MNRKLINALELAKDGKWDQAHKIVQEIENSQAFRIHAYLHRKEGDIGNANYWYRRANSTMPDKTSEEEWQMLWQELN